MDKPSAGIWEKGIRFDRALNNAAIIGGVAVGILIPASAVIAGSIAAGGLIGHEIDNKLETWKDRRSTSRAIGRTATR